MSEVSVEASLWQNALARLEQDERVAASMMGFAALASVKGIIGETLYLEVPNDMTRSMFEQRMKDVVNEAIEAVSGETRVNSFAVVVNSTIASSYTPTVIASSPAPIAEDEIGSPMPGVAANETSFNNSKTAGSFESKLNSKYTFENFVMGSTNIFARAAAFAVAESPAKAYNPLFIYGNSGLGKTHLLHAIGHYALSLYPRFKVRYVSSEEFTNDFINAIQNNRSAAFLTEYRDIDVLLIDDIQFLSGKDQTQEAFFHTFNALHDANKQVVITSDVAPKDLNGFEDRMLSRFEWGLRVDIQTPELETRIAILRKKAELEKIRIPDECLEFIAERVQSNVRELEGTLIRVIAYANLSRKQVDLGLVQTVLKDVTPTAQDTVIAPIEIINAVATYYKITADEIYGTSRTAAIAMARQIAMYICCEMTNLSLPKIGQLFGNRDHTTVMYAHRKVTEWMRERRYIYTQVSELMTKIRNDHRSF
ncbi:MAG: chromosomal replication initiator protein DnaA [Microbacteriaceae bacterium]